MFKHVQSQDLDFKRRVSWSFCVQGVNVRRDCSFCRYWWNCLNHLFITSSLWVVKSLNVIVNVKSKDVYDIVT